MYKKQMTLQRITSYLLLAAAALVFVYSLGIMTDLHGSFALASSWKENKRYYFEGAKIYLEMQPFNRELTIAGIVLILSAASLFLFKSHDRRKYYVANYITIGINALANVGVSVWALIKVFSYKYQFVNNTDFEGFKAAAEMYKFPYLEPTDTFWFDISILVFGILIAFTALSIFNLVWKIVLMSQERKLIEEGKEN